MLIPAFLGQQIFLEEKLVALFFIWFIYYFFYTLMSYIFVPNR